MKLKKLSFTSFRNLEQAELSFGSRFNIFIGNNGQGKTNLLESIYLLGTMKSFRHARNSELICWGSPYAALHGVVERNGIEREISLLLEKQAKKIRVDRKQVSRLADFFGSLNAVVFSPEEMAMVKGMPDGRRQYLDRAIFSGDAGYLQLYHRYYLILKNRNSLLRQGEETGLDVWSDQLAEAGAKLIASRTSYLEEISPLLKEFYGAISGGGEEAGVDYLSHLPGSGSDQNDRCSLLREALAASSAEERRRGTTIVGPHRDDVQFLLNGRAVKRFASQGQQRSFVLALKMAEISHLEKKFGHPPILLLDDMTSELDQERNLNLMAFLEQKRMQVFITTTALQNISLHGVQDNRTFHLDAGRVLS